MWSKLIEIQGEREKFRLVNLYEIKRPLSVAVVFALITNYMATRLWI
jgi:hypothetical protein